MDLIPFSTSSASSFGWPVGKGSLCHLLGILPTALGLLRFSFLLRTEDVDEIEAGFATSD
jgi:hypothetical protein